LRRNSRNKKRVQHLDNCGHQVLAANALLFRRQHDRDSSQMCGVSRAVVLRMHSENSLDPLASCKTRRSS
jgi:hypothetical protein